MTERKFQGRLLKFGNLTGSQIHKISDYLLYRAIRPVFLYTTFLDSFPVDVLNCTEVYGRRKLSSDSNDELQHSVLRLLTLPKEKAWVGLTKCGLERSLWIRRVRAFEQVAGRYLHLHRQAWAGDADAQHGCLALEEETGAGPLLYGVCQNFLEDWQQFFIFRDSISEQFYFLAKKAAYAHVKVQTKPINIDDLIQNLMSMIAKSLDRYDSSKGALTSYLKLWLKNSVANGQNIEGLAYDVPNSVRQRQATGESQHLNFAVSLNRPLADDGGQMQDYLEADTPTPEQEVASASSTTYLAKLIKAADPTGVFRLLHDVPETFTPQELRILAAGK